MKYLKLKKLNKLFNKSTNQQINKSTNQQINKSTNILVCHNFH